MKLQNLLLSVLSASAITLSAVAAQAEQFLVLDILPIQEDQTLEAAETYFDAVEPIFARYGLTRSDKVLSVVGIPRGTVKAQVVNLWQSDNPQASFDGIFSDKEYLTHTADRDAIFDLEAATVIVTQRREH